MRARTKTKTGLKSLQHSEQSIKQDFYFSIFFSFSFRRVKLVIFEFFYEFMIGNGKSKENKCNFEKLRFKLLLGMLNGI